MIRFDADPNAVRLIAAGVLAYLTVAATGTLLSPLLPLISLWIFFAARQDDRTQRLLFVVVAALMLLATEMFRASIAWGDFLILAAAVAAGWIPAHLFRTSGARDAERLAQLDRIQAEAGGTARAASPEGYALQQGTDVQAALRDLARRVGARRVVLWRVDDGSRATPSAVAGGALPKSPVTLEGNPLGWSWKEGMQLQLEPVPAWAPATSRVVAIRLRRDGTVGNLLTYEFDTHVDAPTPDEFQDAAAQLRALLGTHEEQSAAAGDRRRLEQLMSVLQRMPIEPDLDVVAHQLLHGALELVDATGGAIALWDDQHGGRVLVCESTDGGPELNSTFEPLSSEMALAARAEAMITRENRPRSGLPVAVPGERWARHPRALASLPLPTPLGVGAVLSIWSSARDRLDEAGLELVRAAAPYLALALNQAREYDRARESAERDPLTGLRNRRAFDRELAAERTRYERYHRPLAVLLIDLDHFKQINDTHGHEAGDAVLQLVAEILEQEVRDNDIPARLGGEEFVVLLPETGLERAIEAGERLRTAIERLTVRWRGATIPVRASIGAASTPECTPDPRALVRTADEALYAAKSQGRNRVVAATGA